MQPFTVGGCPPLTHFNGLTSSELLYRHAASHLTESCAEFSVLQTVNNSILKCCLYRKSHAKIV